MERELDHPPAEPVILDEAHDRSLVGNRVIYEFRFSHGYSRATAASDGTCNDQERACSRGLGRAVMCLGFLADFSVIECPWPAGESHAPQKITGGRNCSRRLQIRVNGP